MKLWTVQPASILKEIEKNGTYRCKEEYSYNLSKKDSLKDSYQWLIQEMETRIGRRPEGVEFPIWAWHTWNFTHQCPDMNSPAFLVRNEDKVLLTLEIPDNEIVLTDFDAWQIVMRKSFLTYETEEEKLESMESYLDSLDEKQYQKAIEESWKNVFDIETVNTDNLVRGQYVQATFWQVKKTYIQSYKILKKEG